MKSNNILYDYIFAGGGCAALSLLCHMAQYKNLHQKNILVIDVDSKNSNDRTWSFWETTPNLFSHLAIKTWNNLSLKYQGVSQNINIAPYEYKTIMGNDFYTYAKKVLPVFNNLTFINETIIKVKNEDGYAVVTTNLNYYKAKTVYNSIFNKTVVNKNESLIWQHFLGYFITTPNNSFDANTATWMDFNMPQQDGMAFMYVLPFTANTALVEYTVFSPTILPNVIYEAENEAYLKKLNITDYKITATEQYAIPMTSHKFKRQNKNIIFIGSMGGATRASTGFTFTNIQKQAAYLAKQLAANEVPHYGYNFNELKHLKFDATLLKILISKKQTGENVFGNLFAKNKLPQILKFLDGETTALETIKIMHSTDYKIFIPAFFKAL